MKYEKGIQQNDSPKLISFLSDNGEGTPASKIKDNNYENKGKEMIVSNGNVQLDQGNVQLVQQNDMILNKNDENQVRISEDFTSQSNKENSKENIHTSVNEEGNSNTDNNINETITRPYPKENVNDGQLPQIDDLNDVDYLNFLYDLNYMDNLNFL
ncbi:unnamed protein product [Meloidogyne enterolobii]|uniref:Uncharacterized protein n=1 Tax=Meloidogyne enterolobii TaxID=390850 RepID=A0ACB0Y729_MELEN